MLLLLLLLLYAVIRVAYMLPSQRQREDQEEFDADGAVGWAFTFHQKFKNNIKIVNKILSPGALLLNPSPRSTTKQARGRGAAASVYVSPMLPPFPFYFQ
uniref:Putative secreted protein n=1 Tax=Anopheles darlingi TaxID=43151 RepID=A0A2M4D0A9_ANODA